MVLASAFQQCWNSGDEFHWLLWAGKWDWPSPWLSGDGREQWDLGDSIEASMQQELMENITR